MVLDIDGLKGVNDRFGHARGDLLLQGFARGLRGTCGSVMCVTGWGEMNLR